MGLEFAYRETNFFVVTAHRTDKKPGFSVGGGRVDLDCWYSLDMGGKTRPYSQLIQNL